MMGDWRGRSAAKLESDSKDRGGDMVDDMAEAVVSLSQRERWLYKTRWIQEMETQVVRTG
jgi:hypothetical protein